MKQVCFIISLLFFTLQIFAQVFNYWDVPVFKNGQQLRNAWAGGLNAPQWASFDLNNDGVEDIYAFDRNGNVHLAFINQDNAVGAIDYKYSKSSLINFPPVENFVLMRDYNGDGVIDIFANAFDEFQQGLKVYGGFIENDELNFERILFPEYSKDIIPYYEDGIIKDQIWIYIPINYPAVEDMDGDGDYDILAMGPTDGKVVYYKNISFEEGFSSDSLLFELEDDCWGKFALLPDSVHLTLSLDPAMCALFDDPNNEVEKNNPHGGSTINFFDVDNDGDKEILYGDLISPNIVLGINGGDANYAWLTGQDATFPTYNIPIDIPFLPATFLLDVNNDGKSDLLASPNQIWGSPDVEAVWYYENKMSNEEPIFEFIQNDFLADGIIDFGTGANPVFVDVDADGLKDLVVGNKEAWAGGNGSASLFLLKNIGSSVSPVFELINEDWLGLSQYFPAIKGLCPAFGDLDNDGDEDLLIGDFEGNLHFFKNTAGVGNPMNFENPVFNWMDIDVGSYSAPCIYDVNKDGLNDLLLGELTGTVNYFPNIGNGSIPDFHANEQEPPNNNYFGKINTQPFGVTAGYSQPVILEFGNKSYLISGSFKGWIKKYLINSDSLDGGSFELLEDQLGGVRDGQITRVFFDDINDDNLFDVVIGNDRGGLSVYQTNLTLEGVTAGSEKYQDFQFKIFPNPSSGELNIVSQGVYDLTVLDILGKPVLKHEKLIEYSKVDLHGLEKGIYFIQIKKGGLIKTEKLVLSK